MTKVNSNTETSRFDSLQQEAFLNLWRTYDKLRAIEEELFDKHGLSAQQYNTLRLLRASPTQSMPTLSLGAKLISRAPDMTRLIDKLEKRGFVKRQRRSDNRRIVEIALTEAGSQLLTELHEPVLQCARTQLGHMEETALRELIELLEKSRHPHEDKPTAWGRVND